MTLLHKETQKELKNALNGLKNADVRYLSDAIRYPSIYAIEKQIEMDLLPPTKSTFTYKGICPVCDNRILLSEQYCSKCGQKLGKVKKGAK